MTWSILLLCFIFSASAQAQSLEILVAKKLKKRGAVVYLIDFKNGTHQKFGSLKFSQNHIQIASLQKLATSWALLERAPHLKKQRTVCSGHAQIDGKKVFCWKKSGHGELNLVQAIAHSCNLYFYRLSQIFSYHDWVAGLKGIQFPSYQGKFKVNSQKDYTGDNWSRKIKLADFLKWISDLRAALLKNKIPEIYWGMKLALEEGTALASQRSGTEILAKTGTSFIKKVPYGLYLGFGPDEKLSYGLLIVIKNAHGFGLPSQLGGDIFAYLQNSIR